ncbi:sarcosine oxidase subunit gamma family protein [Hyphomicrobium sp. 802]|uniref:sarcosine oxidase subunit gamma n=1 Tax=Hyphomicrobium sp. 802 TaxID=1112272 RepID=UPI00045E631B|nr:sarcosine oxidase subunit gamma family protein [Hyphomicrobium sp. 802]
MAEPTMQSPLLAFDLAAQAQPADDVRGVWANEIPLRGYVSLRGNSADPAFVEKVSTAIGVPLPVDPCTFTVANGVKVLWISPDEWMVVCARSRLGELIAALQAGLQGIRSQVADNSGGYTQVLLQGRNALDVLQHASVYNFAALQPGRVVGTTFGKSSVYAYRSGNGFCLLMRRSFADYIWRYLARAAAPYGLGIAAIEATGHAGDGVAG